MCRKPSILFAEFWDTLSSVQKMHSGTSVVSALWNGCAMRFSTVKSRDDGFFRPLLCENAPFRSQQILWTNGQKWHAKNGRFCTTSTFFWHIDSIDFPKLEKCEPPKYLWLKNECIFAFPFPVTLWLGNVFTPWNIWGSVWATRVIAKTRFSKNTSPRWVHGNSPQGNIRANTNRPLYCCDGCPPPTKIKLTMHNK